jgi:hypothetical protein
MDYSLLIAIENLDPTVPATPLPSKNINYDEEDQDPNATSLLNR